MQVATIIPSNLSGVIPIPGSKSHIQRALALALFDENETLLERVSFSDDVLSVLKLIQTLGARVSKHADQLSIIGINQLSLPSTLDVGESGLALRMFTPILALQNRKINITGSGSLMNRSQLFLLDLLRGLGVACESNNGKLPITIQGPFTPETGLFDGQASSQHITGLMMATAIATTQPVTIHVDQPNSQPYLFLTASVLNAFGYKTECTHPFGFTISPRIKACTSRNITIEGDWSSAAFFLAAAAIQGDLILSGLSFESNQADKDMLLCLEQSGVDIQIEADECCIQSTGSLRPFQINATHCPDLFPPLAVLAAFCDGESRIEGVHRLHGKESDRAHTLVTELRKMGVNIRTEQDTMIIRGGSPLQGTTVSSHGDHRIAMALSIAALYVNGTTYVTQADAVKKSYPNFFQQLQQAGALITLNESL
ncbi:MAG: 3-phosphoshikimate 1-carboxyvinyltransferase [Ferruginibacter sp.]